MERQGRNTPSERVRYGWVTLIEGRIPCPGEGYMLRTDRAFVGDGSQEQTSQDLGVLFQYCGRQFCPQTSHTRKSGRSEESKQRFATVRLSLESKARSDTGVWVGR